MALKRAAFFYFFLISMFYPIPMVFTHDKKMRKGDIAFHITVAFLLGIFVASEDWNLGSMIFASIFIVTMIILIRGWMAIRYALVIFASVVIGYIYCLESTGWAVAHTYLPPGKNAAFFGTLVDEPKPAGNFMMFPFKLSHPYNGLVDVFTSINSQLHYGDFIWMRGTVDISKDPSEAPVIFLPQSSLITSHNGFWLKEWSITAKSFVIKKFTQFLTSDKAVLLTGIITGTTNTVSTTLKRQMNDSGTSYIVGMYGYKIAILSMFLLVLLKDHLSRKLLLSFILSAIWLFIFISGGSISAIRAGAMGSLALVASFMGKMTSSRNTLTFTAFIMTLFDPRILLDAAFQLSFLSFLGIYYLGPPINNFFYWVDGGWLQWKEHAMLSLSTNLAIIPVVMNTFGGFSLTSFISNILIMIPWSIVILLGIIILILGSFLPPFVFFAVQLVGLLLSYELFVIRFFSVFILPIPNIFTSIPIIIFYYGLLLIFIYYYGKET